uniref:Uncharacterized protein n=1 Tax=Tanacetum cinerariifolium TaxID=118510 RepID=A0A6L2NZS4_TANCI|nr:hypothetical protein [Tanacetum cinerariifolium]
MSSEFISFKKSLRCWFGSLDQTSWNEHPFYTNQMVSDRRDPDHNKGKTSLEVEPDTEPLITQTFGEIQALLVDYEEELKDDSDEEMYEAGEEIEDETQPPPTDLKPT